MKRNASVKESESVNLTMRIFICPKDRMHERTRWIEMDKFVYRLDPGVKQAVVTRSDKASSVIRRISGQHQPDFEANLTEMTAGFCECGWPYRMLLPRGTSKGEEYVLFVMATDNNYDQIGVRTHCGSMSYCGARDKEYPDRQRMGYPFSGPLLVNGEKHELIDAFDKINHAAWTSFIIQNNIKESSRIPIAEVWSPDEQLGITGELTDEIRPSDKQGMFRVLIDNDRTDITPDGKPRIRFQGRGKGKGTYKLTDVFIEKKYFNSKERFEVLCGKQATFDVPEDELFSDEIEMDFDAGVDYYVTFRALSPVAYFRSTKRYTNTEYYSDKIPPPRDNKWFSSARTQRLSGCYCISGVLIKENKHE